MDSGELLTSAEPAVAFRAQRLLAGLLIQWPIRFYDVLSALVVMTEVGRVRDPRCADALHHLAAKRLPNGGFPAELRTARTVAVVASDGTFADWGPSGRARANPYVTIDADWVLRESLDAPAPAPAPAQRSGASA